MASDETLSELTDAYRRLQLCECERRVLETQNALLRDLAGQARQRETGLTCMEYHDLWATEIEGRV